MQQTDAFTLKLLQKDLFFSQSTWWQLSAAYSLTIPINTTYTYIYIYLKILPVQPSLRQRAGLTCSWFWLALRLWLWLWTAWWRCSRWRWTALTSGGSRDWKPVCACGMNWRKMLTLPCQKVGCGNLPMILHACVSGLYASTTSDSSKVLS